VIRSVEGADDVQQRALPRARGTNDRDCFSDHELKVDVSQYRGRLRDIRGSVALGDVSESEELLWAAMYVFDGASLLWSDRR